MTEVNDDAPKKYFGLNRSHLQGFIAGVLITAIVAVGVYVAADNNEFLTGTVSSSLSQKIGSDLEEAWGGRDYARVRALTRLDNEIRYAESVKGNSLTDEEVIGLINSTISEMREILTRYTAAGRTDMVQETEQEISILQAYLSWQPESAPETEEPTVQPDSTPAQTATTYYLYPVGSAAFRDATSSSGDCTGEIVLMAPYSRFDYDKGMENYLYCDGSALDADAYSSLYSLIGSSNLPDLSLTDRNSNPLRYQICFNGATPTNTAAAAATAGNIRYYAREGLPGNSYVGEIKLIKNLDEAQNPGLMRCEGNMLSVRQYQALFSLLGNTFGGDGVSTYAVPDLSNVAPPVEGAKYYIVVNGTFPRMK